jgi:hypothetical protein
MLGEWRARYADTLQPPAVGDDVECLLHGSVLEEHEQALLSKLAGLCPHSRMQPFHVRHMR